MTLLSSTKDQPSLEGSNRTGALRSWQRILTQHSLLRFLLVGGLSFVVDFGLLFLLGEVLGVPVWIAASVAFWSAVAVNFTLNRFFTFSAQNPTGWSLVRYGTVLGVNYLVTLLVLTGAENIGVHYLAAKILVVGVQTVTNYLLYRYWVFAPRRHKSAR